MFVAVATNPRKSYAFTIDEWLKLLEKVIKEETKDCSTKIVPIRIDGLLVDFAAKNNVNFLIWGLRSHQDFDEEIIMAVINRKISNGLETVMLMANDTHIHISSTNIWNLFWFGKMIDGFVPKSIENEVKEKLFPSSKVQ